MAISAEKAKTILKDGTVNGNKLSPKQKRFFGAIAGGAKMQKAADGAGVSSRSMIADGMAEMKDGGGTAYYATHGFKDGGGTKWIQGAIKHPGALTAQAKAAGMSPMAFAAKHKGDKGTTGKRARLAMTLKKMHGMAEGGGVEDEPKGEFNENITDMIGTADKPMPYGGYGLEDAAKAFRVGMAEGGGTVDRMGYSSYAGENQPKTPGRMIMEGYAEGGAVDPAAGLQAVAQVAALYGDKGIAALRLGQAAARRLHNEMLSQPGFRNGPSFDDLLRQETKRAFMALGGQPMGVQTQAPGYQGFANPTAG